MLAEDKMDIAKFLPYRRFTINTNKTHQEVLNLVDYHAYGKNTFFKGHIDRDSFVLRRRIQGRTSFNPVIVGKVIEHSQGCDIKIIIRPDCFELAFIAFYIYIISQGVWIMQLLGLVFLCFILMIAWQIYDGFANESSMFLKGLF
jgi:hypothetical protein